MSINRRAFVVSAAAAVLLPRVARAATVTDATGRELPIPGKVARVFPAGPAGCNSALHARAGFVARLATCQSPGGMCLHAAGCLHSAEVGRITGRGNTANLESVIALKPDLILDVGSTSATFVSLAERVQQQTGIPYALLDGRFDAIAATYRKLGELTGRQNDFEKLARYADDTIKATTGRIAAIEASARPRVYYARGPRGLATGLGGSINVETIEMLARNVASGNQGGLANVSIEQVLLWNPDVIVTIDQEFAASVRGDPAWSAVKAVRDGRVHLSPKMPFGWVDFPPSVNRLIGLWWLAKILYPDKFPEDIRALTRDFYSMYYHRTPSDAQIDHVLAGRD